MNPATVLVEQLAAARREGVTFAVAWPAVLAAALAAVPGKCERSEWADVLGEMAQTWAEAFERRPADRRERALVTIAHDPERVPLPERPCGRCGEPIPPNPKGRAIYCSADCRLLAKKRAAVAA